VKVHGQGRSPRGGGPDLFRAGALVAALALGGGFAARPAAALTFPAAATGDLWFQADHAGFRDSTGVVTEEFYIRLPNNQIEFETVDTDSGQFLEGRVFVRLKFYDEEGREVGEATQRFEFRAGSQEEAETPDRVRLLLVRDALHPRTHEVEVVVEDLNARKRGLIYLITKKRKNGSLRARLLPPPAADRFGLSDLQFAWGLRRAAPGTPFHKRGWAVIPNPGRTYGLYQDSLRVYYELYDADAGRRMSPAVARYEIRDEEGALLAARVDTLRGHADPGRSVTFPLENFPAGTFDLSVRVLSAAGDTARAVRPFNVLWEAGSWARTEEDVLDEARAVLPEAEYDAFREMPFGERESHLAAFWASQDPSPNTAKNERRSVFLARVAFADRNYSTPLERGMTSDRGRVFIRYGQPDEVTREEMPRPGNTLSDVLGGVDFDDADVVSDRTARSRRDGLTSANFMDVDTRPYEIWRYNGQGDPLFLERERTTRNTGFVFVFVDDQGIGAYRLRWSNAGQRF
jgi:GWxTD domain-containing protein